MSNVTSADGTPIAFERLGEGDPVILIGGATCDRGVTHPLAERMAARFTVINPDRRGRGDSGDTDPYAVEREIEDLDALIAVAGGSASLYGHSSGAGLVLHAAAAGLPVTRFVLHDAPYTSGEEEERVAREYGENLEAILSEGRNGDAVELFMTLVGMPAEVIDGMRQSPAWPRMEAIAPTLAYDSTVMGDISRGGTFPADVAAKATAPALVLVGGASPPFMLETGGQLADVLPDGRLEVLEGQDHAAAPEAVAPVLERFLAGL